VGGEDMRRLHVFEQSCLLATLGAPAAIGPGFQKPCLGSLNSYKINLSVTTLKPCIFILPLRRCNKSSAFLWKTRRSSCDAAENAVAP